MMLEKVVLKKIVNWIVSWNLAEVKLSEVDSTDVMFEWNIKRQRDFDLVFHNSYAIFILVFDQKINDKQSRSIFYEALKSIGIVQTTFILSIFAADTISFINSEMQRRVQRARKVIKESLVAFFGAR